jgi:5-methylcytosine-specific restriction enzyme B
MNDIMDSLTEIDEAYRQYRDKGRIEFVTFHPSYSYEEFVEGITVETDSENIARDNPQYKLRPGSFKNMCKNALAAAIQIPIENSEEPTWRGVFTAYQKNNDVDFSAAPRYVLIIDEINRGDIAKIFGELITLVEADKRLGERNEVIVRLPTSGDLFGVPPNLYMIGTMNTADRSIALLDVALRRRFGFVEMNPDFSVLTQEYIQKNEAILKDNHVYDLLRQSTEALQRINKKLCADPTIGRDRQIGHSFLFKVYTKEDLLLVWKHEVFPLLEEYCYGNYKKINHLLFNKDGDTEWIGELEGIKDIKDISAMIKAIV